MKVITGRNLKKKKGSFIKGLFKADRKERLGGPDFILMGSIFLILLFGLVMLSSASSVEAFRRYGDTYYYFKHHLYRGVIPGLVLFYIFYKFDYRKLEKYTVGFFVLAVMLLLLVFIPGIGTTYGTGARSWLNLGGFSLQPSEIVKLLLILFLSGWFYQRGKEMNRDFWNGLFPFVIVLGIICLLIILQPDIGTLSVVVMISILMYFIAGARLSHLVGLVVAGAGMLGILIVQAPYRAARLMTFLHPELDPQGIGYHINQAFLAVGSGGWFGLGFGQSRQKFAYLPEVMGDSIFAIIAEELGFVFSLVLIALFIVLLFRGLKIAQNLQDGYGKYIMVGIVGWFSLQAFFNIAAMVGLVPLTGIPLPFVSYGGTAMMINLAAAGLLVNVSRHSTE